MSNAEKRPRGRPLNKICWLLVACCTLVSFTGCASRNNSFTQFYKDKAGAEMTNLPAYSGSTRILTTSNAVNDAKDLYRDGYTLLGFSDFEGPRLTDGGVRFQAKQVGADVVLVSRAYLRTETPPTPWPSRMNSMGMFTAPGIPVTVRVYQYQAGFFRRGRPAILGVFYRAAPSEIRQKLERNTGVFVFVVRNGSPAFNANLLEGDVILKTDGEDVMSEADMREKLNKLAGRKVELEIWRDGRFKTISVQLNKKP
jgi:hypothetical protein